MSSPQGFSVVYEDNHLLLVNKASGVLVQGDKTGDEPLAELGKAYLKGKYNKPGAVFLGVIHRLDRPVTGLVAMAKTSKALARMNALFREKEMEKTYWALVGSKPREEAGHLVHFLSKDEKKNKATAYTTERAGALRSELDYKVMAHSEGTWLLEVKPLTGRPHQIRVQLASMGCPIKGDVKYGDDKPNADGSICLHARSLSFVHPVKNEGMTFTAPMPRAGLWKKFLAYDGVSGTSKSEQHTKTGHGHESGPLV